MSQSRTLHSARVRSLPAAFVRDITRPAPCTVEYSSSREAPESEPRRITDGSPIVAPTNPSWPGKAGVQPLRITHTSVPKWFSRQAKLWWLWTDSVSCAPRISSTLATTVSRPA